MKGQHLAAALGLSIATAASGDAFTWDPVSGAGSWTPRDSAWNELPEMHMYYRVGATGPETRLGAPNLPGLAWEFTDFSVSYSNPNGNLHRINAINTSGADLSISVFLLANYDFAGTPENDIGGVDWWGWAGQPWRPGQAYSTVGEPGTNWVLAGTGGTNRVNWAEYPELLAQMEDALPTTVLPMLSSGPHDDMGLLVEWHRTLAPGESFTGGMGYGVSPLPSGAAMGLVGLATLATMRRRG